MMKINQTLNPNLTAREVDSFARGLHQRVIGQDEAIRQVVNIYQMFLAGMSSPRRPIGNYLFLGPTGTGKTRLVEAVAECLVGNPEAVIKIDCAEYQHSHETAKLVGSPPGYLGHRETPALLQQKSLNKFHTEKLKLSFVLFDEIEKASDALWNLLLGIMDKGTLTLGDNTAVDFSRCMIFLTSNVGASEMGAILRPCLGFGSHTIRQQHDGGHLDEEISGRIARASLDAARKRFTPEFINRIDQLVVFHPLGDHELLRIVDLELQNVQRRVFESHKENAFMFYVTEPAKKFLLAEGTDVRYGARHLKRAIEKCLVFPLSNLITTQQVRAGDLIAVDCTADQGILTFSKQAEGIPSQIVTKCVGDHSLAETTIAAAIEAQPVPAFARSVRRS
jgi:ATP-dependent Clp protease ATP-binding subunit ClpA